MAEQRYQAVLAVISNGRTITEVAAQWAVSRQTLHAWLARYEAEGLDGLGNRSHRSVSCPHQMPAAVTALVLEMWRGQLAALTALASPARPRVAQGRLSPGRGRPGTRLAAGSGPCCRS